MKRKSKAEDFTQMRLGFVHTSPWQWCTALANQAEGTNADLTQQGVSGECYNTHLGK